METPVKVQIPKFHGEHDHDAVNIKIVIDLEDHCKNSKPHPQPDPGTVVYYLIRIDEQQHEVKAPGLLGKQILGLASKEYGPFLLYQVRQKYGEAYLEPIGPDEYVDFTALNVESFSVKQKTYRIVVQKKEYTTTQQYLTVRQILTDLVHVDPTIHTLARKDDQHEYNDLDELIDLECVKAFVLFNNQPTPVS